MDKLKMHSPDLTEQNIEKLAELFPTVVTERLDDEGNPVRAIDFDLLSQELSDYLVVGPEERYRLDWPGKREALFVANAPIAKTLRPVRDESVNFDATQNLFIEGDNLEALKLLQESYLGRIKLMYIDPPYNTGNDLVYDDDFAETTTDYLVRSGQADVDGIRLIANTEANGRFHSDWLSMIYPRLKLARNLLTDDGMLLVSIDDNELPRLRQVLDEVFGDRNFIGQFIWKKGGTGKNDSRYAVVEHEYVVGYSRNVDKSCFLSDPEGTVTTVYNREDEIGKYSLVRLDSKTLGYVESLDFEIVKPGGGSYRPEQPAGQEKVARWRWGREKVSAELESLVFENGFVYTKNYEKAGAKPRSLLVDDRFGVTRTGRKEAEIAIGEDGLFDFPKPVRLIRHLLAISTSDDDIVMDFFAGSGTTAQAVMELNLADGGNRRFILVQIDEAVSNDSRAGRLGYATIAQLTRQRLRGAGDNLRASVTSASSLGFRCLKVDTTNMAHVLRTPNETDQQDLPGMENSIKADRTAEDLLFQVLLDWGLELTMPIAVEEIEEHEVFIVEEGALIACFDLEVSPALVREIANRQPLRAVFRDSGFATDAARINAEQVFTEVAPATDVKAI